MLSNPSSPQPALSRRLQFLAQAAVAALALFVLIRAIGGAGFAFDDAYITYRYAENIAAGQGFVYNLGERVLGTTTPLYTLILAAARFVGADLPRFSVVLGGAFGAASVILVWALGRRDDRPAVGLLAAAWLALDPLPYSTLGMETTAYMGLCLLALYLQRRNLPVGSAVAAGLAFLTRWDGVLVGVIILLAEWRRTRRLPWTMAAVLFLVASPWLIFAQLYFGSIFPNTFFAKLGQASSGLVGGGTAAFGEGLLQLARQRAAAEPLHWLALAFMALGLARLAVRRPDWWPVIAWTGLYTAGYIVLGVTNFHWYYGPVLPGLALLVGSGAAALAGGLAPRLPQRLDSAGQATVCLLAAVCVLWPQARLLQDTAWAPAPNVAAYEQVGRWLREHTAPGSTVALLEIGVVGYVSERPVIDMMGLVTPSMLGRLDNWDQVQAYAIANHWPDYVLALSGSLADRLGQDPSSWFAQTYQAATTVSTSGDPMPPMTLYARRPGFPPAAWSVEWPADSVFDNSFALVGLAVEDERFEPAAPFTLRLDWQALEAVEADYRFRFELVELTTGERWLLEDQSMPYYGGNPTVLWQPGEAFSEVRRMTWPAEAPPGAYRLLARALREGLEVTPTAEGTGRGQTAMTGVLTSGSPPTLDPITPALLDLADGISLLGYRLVSGGADWQLELRWSAEAAPTQDYTVFVHYYDAGGNLIAQHDSPPALGRLPTTWWGVGVPVSDLHPIGTAVETIARFCVGLYEPTSLERLRVEGGGEYSVADNVACHALSAPGSSE